MSIEEKVAKILERNSKIKEIDKKDLDKFTFYDLGVNSLNFIKIIVELEEEFDIEFEDDQINYGLLSNISELVKLIKAKLEQKNY